MTFNNQELKKILSTTRKEFNAQAMADSDRGLPEEQREEWSAIYASYESRSILQGTICGMESVPIPTGESDEHGKPVMEPLHCMVVIQHYAKVLIPEPFFRMEEGVSFALSSTIGAKIDYIIIGVDRAGGCAVASRAMAMEQQRWYMREVRRVQAGDVIPMSVLAVGPTRLTLTAGGYDTALTQSGISYQYLSDLRELYHPGQELSARVLEITEQQLVISIKDVGPDPYEDAALRHPVGASRVAVITNKFHGAVFCRLPDGCTVVCKYAKQFSDDQFAINDRVLVQIRHFDDAHHWLRGKIRAKV